jgi:HK97 family phage major capsid protein
MEKMLIKDFVAKVKTLIEAGMTGAQAKDAVVKQLEKKGYTGSFILKEDGETVGHADVDFKELEEEESKEDSKAFAKSLAAEMTKGFEKLGKSLTVPATPRDEKEASLGGFKDISEFYSKAFTAFKGGSMDARLKASATTAMGEDVGESGGFALPRQMSEEILRYMGLNGPNLLSRTMNIPLTGGNSFSIPMSQDTPWGGGIQAKWQAELIAANQTKPNMNLLELKLNALQALVPVGDDVLADAPKIGNFVSQMAAEALEWRVNQSLFTGSGVGQPQGILNSGALVTVAAQSGQASQTINYSNLTDMYTAHIAPENAAWFVTPKGAGQLLKMTMPGNQIPAATSLLTGYSAKPLPSIYTLPIVQMRACSKLGQVGDIVLADFSKYMTISKDMQAAVSIHLFFDAATSAFRFRMRLDGKTMWSKPITDPNDKTFQQSHFVALAARP